MPRLKGSMVDITEDDLEKLEAIVEYCNGVAGAADWLKVASSSITKWRKAHDYEGVQFREEARKRINKLYKETQPIEAIPASPKVPCFNKEHPLMLVYKLARKTKGAEKIANMLAHMILEDA